MVEGTFEGQRKTMEVHRAERSQIIRHEDNLKITDGQFYSETTSKSDYQREIEENRQIRRNTFTKEEVENLNEDLTESTTIRRRTWTKEDFDAIKYKQPERPQQVKPVDNLKPEGNFYSPEKSEFKAAERPKQVKPQDNLKQTGNYNFNFFLKNFEFGNNFLMTTEVKLIFPNFIVMKVILTLYFYVLF
jgi:hypothetical protein